MAESLSDAVEQQEKANDQQERWEKVQQRLEKVRQKQLEATKKQAAAERELYLAKKGTLALAQQEIDNMVWGAEPKAFGRGGAIPEADALLRENFDAQDMASFNAEMEKYNAIQDSVNTKLADQAAMITMVAGAFQDMFYTALISGEDFFKQMGQWVENFIKRMAAAAAAAAALTLITGGTGTGFGAIFSQLIGLPKLAHGGIVNKATPLIAGEAGPEAIIPLNKLNSMGGNLTARISGRDLLLLLEREQTIKNRVYG